jgi:hypothetical protein
MTYEYEGRQKRKNDWAPPQGKRTERPQWEPVDASHLWLKADSTGTEGTDPRAAPEKIATAHVDDKKHNVSGLDAIEDHETTETEELLHPDEIFRDISKNYDSKKRAFNALKEAIRQRQQATTEAESAHTPKAREAKEKALAAAEKNVEAQTERLKNFIVEALLPSDSQGGPLLKQLEQAKRQKNEKSVHQLEAALDEVRSSLRARVDAMKHTEPGHQDRSVFEPEPTEVTHHDFSFPEGEHIKVRDHAVAYSTTAPLGVDSDSERRKQETQQSHAAVQDEMEHSGLSVSRAKILKAISSFEGGFDTVNTYDKAGVTWGFVQWTGASHSDLTQALSIIKQRYPEAFARSFEAYGIDIVKDQIVITSLDSSGRLVGEMAAAAIVKDPRLAAALSHAGRNKDVQKGEIEAAEKIEIEAALQMKIEAGGHSFTAGQIMTSEYGVGLLANSYVHSGSGAAHRIVQETLVAVVVKHPYQAGDDNWAAMAEAAISRALAAQDAQRSAELAKLLSSARGTFQP